MTATERTTSLRFLPGVGPKRAGLLAAIGLHDVVDLLHHAPRCLAAAPDERGAAELPRGGRAQVRGRVLTVAYTPFGRVVAGDEVLDRITRGTEVVSVRVAE